MEELAKYLRASLLLDIWNTQQDAERSGVAPPRFELLLAESGFSTKEIADLLGKSLAAVSKALTRARTARRGGQRDDQSDLGEDVNGNQDK